MDTFRGLFSGSRKTVPEVEQISFFIRISANYILYSLGILDRLLYMLLRTSSCIQQGNLVKFYTNLEDKTLYSRNMCCPFLNQWVFANQIHLQGFYWVPKSERSKKRNGNPSVHLWDIERGRNGSKRFSLVRLCSWLIHCLAAGKWTRWWDCVTQCCVTRAIFK
jgi:hypothetical protein